MLQVLSAERQGVQEMSSDGTPRSQGPEAMAQAQEVRGYLETKPVLENVLGHMRGKAKNGFIG
jgi:hypothetical protein